MPPTLCVGSITGAWVNHLLCRQCASGVQMVCIQWAIGVQIESTERTNAINPMPIDPKISLRNLTARAKARRLLDMLPIIEAKIVEGVSHREIIHALSAQGLELSRNTYFSYLRRNRRKHAAAKRQGVQARSVHPLPPAASDELPEEASLGGENSARRPPTFDFDPRGIPELLK